MILPAAAGANLAVAEPASKAQVIEALRHRAILTWVTGKTGAWCTRDPLPWHKMLCRMVNYEDDAVVRRLHAHFMKHGARFKPLTK